MGIMSHCLTMRTYQSLNISHKNLVTCTLIVRLHKYIICFDLDMYFLIDSNMSTIVITINKCMHLVMFYYFAAINCKYHNNKACIYCKLAGHSTSSCPVKNTKIKKVGALTNPHQKARQDKNR